MFRASLLIPLLCVASSQVLSDSIASSQIQNDSIAEVNVPCDKLPSAEIDFSHDTGRFTITIGRQTISATSIRFRKLNEGSNACAVELANFTFLSEEPVATLEEE